MSKFTVGERKGVIALLLIVTALLAYMILERHKSTPALPEQSHTVVIDTVKTISAKKKTNKKSKSKARKSAKQNNRPKAPVPERDPLKDIVN